MATRDVARPPARVANNWQSLLLIFLLGAAIMVYVTPRRPQLIQVTLPPPFVHQREFAYVAKVPGHWTSDAQSASGSWLRLRENERDLGPAHVLPDAVANNGYGSFMHWNDIIYFSTSDNSDPNTNGRQYSIIAPALRFPLVSYVVVLFSLYLTGSFLLHMGADRLHGNYRYSTVCRRTSLAVAHLILAGFFAQLVFGLLIANRLSKEGRTVDTWYSFLFGGGELGFQPGTSINYVEHHYLNYALNPEVPYGAMKQYNSIFRIRRTEHIRPRSDVKWRLLVLGGSTTFGERLPREQDTWVYQLEALIRGRYGADVDVLNGGVGGYTIAENFIHYVTLLTNLSPDAVLLYTGINDVHPRLFGRLTYDYSNYRIPWRSTGSVLSPVNWALTWFYPYRYYFLATKIVPLNATGIGGLTSGPYPPSDKWTAALEANGPEIYKNYLESLVQFILAQGRPVGILPQYFRVVTESDAIFARGVVQHNLVNQEVATKLKIPFATEFTDAKAFSLDDTFDSCHFTAVGGKTMARLVFNFLDRSHLLPSTASPTSSYSQRGTPSHLEEPAAIAP